MASGQSFTIGGFIVYYDSDPIIYEDGSSLEISWSPGNTGGRSLEFTIKSNKSGIAVFDNYSTTYTSNWHGKTKILPRSEGKFTLLVELRDNGTLVGSRSIPMEIKYRTVYTIDTETVNRGENSSISLSSRQNVQSTKWTVSNPDVTIVSQNAGTLTVMAKKTGTVNVSAEITLVTGDKKNASKTIDIRDRPLWIDGNNIAVVSNVSGGQDLKYYIGTPPSGAKFSWETDNPEAVIVSGQGTNEVIVNAGEISNFKLSATVEYGTVKRVLTRNVRLIEFVLDNFSKEVVMSSPVFIGGSGYRATYDIRFLDNGTKEEISGSATWYISYDARISQFKELHFVYSPNDFAYYKIDSYKCKQVLPLDYLERFFFFNQYKQNTKLPAFYEHFDAYFMRPGDLDNYLKMKALVRTEDGKSFIHEFMIYYRHDYENPYPVLVSSVDEKPEIQSMSKSLKIATEEEFDNSSEIDVNIYTLTQGSLVYSKKRTLNFNINEAPIPSGYYILRMTDSKGNVKANKVYKK